MIRVGLVGGRGYVGSELLSLLDGHSEFEVAYVGSSTLAGQSVSENGELTLKNDLKFQPLDPQAMLKAEIDVWVLAQPNGKAAPWVEQLRTPTTRFLDVSYDFRFDKDWVYGLPEKNRASIKGARQVSNPGCYATSTQLALLPVLDHIAAAPTAFGVSGFSGAGKKPSERNSADRLADNLIPYSLVGHGHEKEISFQMGRPVNFIPHVAQFFRGISVTVNIPISSNAVQDSWLETYQEFYKNEPLVDICASIPEISQVRESPRAMIGGFQLDESGERLVVVSVIDNLQKGAASQAMQNLNLMFEFDETLGIV